MPRIPGTHFSVTHTHATAAAATKAAPGAGKRILITDIAGSSDKSPCLLQVIEDAAGSPVIKWAIQIAVVPNYTHTFKTPLEITANKSATVSIDGTALCKANIAGKVINN